MNPEVVIIGQSSEKAGLILEQLHSRICENSPPFRRMSLASAEIAKVSLNAYITMKISFANLIGNICSKVKNTDPDAITMALGMDKRISPYYFRPGLAYGGTCFPRDTWALLSVLKKLELPLGLMQACETINSYQDSQLAEHVAGLARKRNTTSIGIIGLAFKPNTPVIVKSPAINLAETLLSEGFKVIAYDPLAMENAKAHFGENLRSASSVSECLDSAPVCVLTLTSKKLAEDIYAYPASEPKEIIDCWRILDNGRLPEKILLAHQS